MNEPDLLKQIKSGDKKAFELLFRRYILVLEEYAYFYTSSRPVAEDIIQDLFFNLWENRNKLVINTSLKAYLFRAVHNNCIQYLRHLKVTEKYNSVQKNKLEEAQIMNHLFFEDGLNRLFESDIDKIVKSSLVNLPEKTRNIYHLSREKHLKNNEIAIEVNLTEKSVEYHISKALEVLRSELKDYLPLIILILLKY